MAKLAKQISTFLKEKLVVKNTPKNWVLKTISLVLGIFIWYFVVGEDQVDMNVRIPLEILNLPADLVISNQYKKEIEVSVRGPRSFIQDIGNRNITRSVDLSGQKPGTFVVQNNDDSIPFPRGITVLRLQPANISLVLDKLIKKNFPIEPLTTGEPSKGFVLGDINLTPSNLSISGPQTILDSEKDLKTALINIEGLNRSTTIQVNLDLSPEFIDLIGDTVVTAKLEIREKTIQKTIQKIPVNVRDSNQNVTITPNNITVSASIPENLLKDTPELAMLFRASVTATNITKPTDVLVTVNGVSVPGHDPIIIQTIEPAQVTVSPIAPPPNPPSEDKTKQNKK